MEARIVREELVKCQRGEGVNHYKKCQYLAEMYTGMIRDNKVRNMIWVLYRLFLVVEPDSAVMTSHCCRSLEVAYLTGLR
jgi:pantothenate synthetase